MKEFPKYKAVFLCGARDFHAMDWYMTAKSLNPLSKIQIVTDLIEGEGYEKLIQEDDQVYKLFILDPFLLSQQSKFADAWRNLLKLIVLPLQVILLKRFAHANPGYIYHAHSMYYLVLAALANVNYIGTPQGSDILVKPGRSWLYKNFSIFGLMKARHLTVDSRLMKDGIKNLVDRTDVSIIQNGISISKIRSINENLLNQEKNSPFIYSVRGLTALYDIESMFLNRGMNNINIPIYLSYPFSEARYKMKVKAHFNESDRDLGKSSKENMYKLMKNALVMISIPLSDSSPKSVYEAIFCGCPVAIAYNKYYESLPTCMKKRIILVKKSDNQWLEKVIKTAVDIKAEKYQPSQEALNIFDQNESFKIVEKLYQKYL